MEVGGPTTGSEAGPRRELDPMVQETISVADADADSARPRWEENESMQSETMQMQIRKGGNEGRVETSAGTSVEPETERMIEKVKVRGGGASGEMR